MKKIFLLFFILYGSFMSSYAAEDGIPKVKDTLVIGYNISPPFTLLKDGLPDGLSYRLWRKLLRGNQEFHLIYKQLPLDSLLLGLRNNEVDIAISPITITSKRNAYIDYSVPYYISNSGALIKAKNNERRWSSIAKTIFSWKFFKFIFLGLILLVIFGIIVWLFERKANKEEFGHGMRGIWNSIWWSAVTMTTVGYGDKTPRTLGGRLVGLLWMFIGIILVSIVTASITSSLTIIKMEINSENMAEYKNKPIATVKNSATERWLIDNSFSNVKRYHTYQEMIQALRDDKVFLAAYDEPLLRYIVQNDRDNELVLLKAKYNFSMYAFGFNKNLSKEFEKEISSRILKVIESKEWKELLYEFNLENPM